MKIKGFTGRLIISLIVASPVLYWRGNIVDETRIDVFFMALMVVLFVAGVLLAWLLNPLFKR